MFGVIREWMARYELRCPRCKTITLYDGPNPNVHHCAQCGTPLQAKAV